MVLGRLPPTVLIKIIYRGIYLFMAVTITLSDVIVYASTLMKNQRLNINNLQPGVTMGNKVLQRMLSAPFIWRFNRKTLSFPVTKAGGTEYVVAVSDLGRIEAQWLVDSASKIHELKGAQSLPRTSMVNRPQRVAPVYDDNQGNITFRIDTVPDASYTVNIDYQAKAQLLTSYAQPFGPFPDEFEYLYSTGFLAEAALTIGDARFNIWNRQFSLEILATQDGLDAQAKEIFLEQMLGYGRTALRSQASGSLGNQARAQM